MEELLDTDFEAADQLATNALIQGLKSSTERGSLVLMLTTVAAGAFQEVVRELKSACTMMHADEAHEAYGMRAAGLAVNTYTWHRRRGHPGERALMSVAAEAQLTEVVAVEIVPHCHACKLAKQAREPFVRSSSRAEKPLDLLHTDVMGPFHFRSWGGKRYAVTLMDDHFGMAEEVFGCIAYVHVPNAKRKKLDACAEVGFHVGYESDCKAWRIFVWRKGRFVSIKSRTVHFDESETVKMPLRQEFVEHYENPIPEHLLHDIDPPTADDAAVNEDAWDAAAGDDGDGWQENEPRVGSDDEPSDDDDGARGGRRCGAGGALPIV
eukprot:jgi/Ulvmu1/4257/UM193_0005.1